MCPAPAETVQTASHILTELARARVTAELLQPGELVSGMLLQVDNGAGGLAGARRARQPPLKCRHCTARRPAMAACRLHMPHAVSTSSPACCQLGDCTG